MKAGPTDPELRGKTRLEANPLLGLVDTCKPAGATTARSPPRVEPETVKLCAEEAAPYVVVNASGKVAEVTLIVGTGGATGVPWTALLAAPAPAELMPRMRTLYVTPLAKLVMDSGLFVTAGLETAQAEPSLVEYA